MNEMNEWETQLRSWAPRRPSAKLRARLFARPVTPTPPRPAFTIGWLAPAGACLLLAFVILGQRSGAALRPVAKGSPLVAMILSNQSYAAYLPGSFAHGQNVPPRDSFEWTNGSSSTSTMRFVSPLKAND